MDAFFNRPIVNHTAMIVGVLGVALSVVLFLASIQSRKLTCYISPDRKVIFQIWQARNTYAFVNGPDRRPAVVAVGEETGG